MCLAFAHEVKAKNKAYVDLLSNLIMNFPTQFSVFRFFGK